MSEHDHQSYSPRVAFAIRKWGNLSVTYRNDFPRNELYVLAIGFFIGMGFSVDVAEQLAGEVSS